MNEKEVRKALIESYNNAEAIIRAHDAEDFRGLNGMLAHMEKEELGLVIHALLDAYSTAKEREGE